MTYNRPDPVRTYAYRGFRPYGAGELFIMDEWVDPDFSGNVTEELVKKGATWDEARHTLILSRSLELLFKEDA